MKKMYARIKTSLFLLPLSLFAIALLPGKTLVAQTYYSFFNNPLPHSYVINPGGNLCLAPAIRNPTAFADSMPDTYSYFAANPVSAFTCTQEQYYHFVANLNVPGGNLLLDSGYKAGFLIRVPTVITLETLRRYTKISTYTNTGTLLQSATDSIMGIDSLGQNANGNPVNYWYLYFRATKPFNTVEINVDPNIAPLNGQLFEFAVYYAFGKAGDVVFPASIQNFKISASGSNALLSFQSLTENNVAHFTVERSNNGGRSYSPVTTLTAKGNNAAATSYAYTDKALTDGDYLYRIQIVNHDGSAKVTNSLPVSISNGGKLVVYPSVLSGGRDLNIRTSLIGALQILVFDAAGRTVNRQKITSSGSFTIPTASLGKGIYTVKLIPANGSVQQGRFVVN